MQMCKKALFHILNNILLYVLIVFCSWLYFAAIDYTPLASWDEAWYGSIAREILSRGDWWTLHFNGIPFYDHPPMGFWIMALFYKFLGISEFATRLPSVLAGIATAVFMYKLGELLFNKKIIGFVAAIILSTCVWYVIRVRSGNLDSLFLFFYVATVYTAILTRKSFAWFIVCMASFGALVMTKTLAGVSAGIIILWFSIPYLFQSKRNILYLLGGAFIFYIIVMPWYQYHLATNPDFYQHHFINIGARNTTFNLQTFMNLQPELPLFYLHMGVRKWYDPWILSGGIVIISAGVHMVQGLGALLKKKKYDKWILLQGELGLLGWNVTILLPFLTTDLTQIWHLIPVYAPLALVVAYGAYVGLSFGIWLVQLLRWKKLYQFASNPFVIGLAYITTFLIISVLQIKTFYYEVFPTSRYVVDEVDILQRTKKYQRTVYIDRDYLPIAVYYSEQQVVVQSRQGDDVATIQNFVDQNDRGVLVIKNSAVEQYIKADKEVAILEKNNSFSIVAATK